MKICDLKSKIVNSNRKGFSIIELVFAMCFLTLIILGVISLQTGNILMINRQNNQIQANFYANQGVQILKSIGYDSSLKTCTPSICKKIFSLSSDNYNLNDLIGSDELIDSTYERYVEIDADNLQNAYRATVYVEWDDSTGHHSVNAKTIIF